MKIFRYLKSNQTQKTKNYAQPQKQIRHSRRALQLVQHNWILWGRIKWKLNRFEAERERKSCSLWHNGWSELVYTPLCVECWSRNQINSCQALLCVSIVCCHFPTLASYFIDFSACFPSNEIPFQFRSCRWWTIFSDTEECHEKLSSMANKAIDELIFHSANESFLLARTFDFPPQSRRLEEATC